MAPQKKKRSKHLPFGCFLVFTFEVCLNAYPTGAPPSACASMLPRHGADPQRSRSPYALEVNASAYRHGQTVKVYISSSETYRGLLLQARSANTSAAVGSWVDLPSHIKTLNCGSGGGSAVTHTSRRDVSGGESAFTWMPPNTGAPQVLEFWATVVKDTATFWTDIKSPLLLLDDVVFGPDVSPPGSGERLSGCVFAMAASVCVWSTCCV